MNRAEKVQVSDELREVFKKAQGIFITDYRGLKVGQLTELRFALKKSGAEFKIVKNRLALRALEPEVAKALEKDFDEMTGVAVSYGDVAAGAKALTGFAKTNDKLKLRAGLVEGRIISSTEIKALSELPSREELLAKLLGTLQAVPAGFVRVLNAVPSGWVNVLESLRKKKEGQ